MLIFLYCLFFVVFYIVSIRYFSLVKRFTHYLLVTVNGARESKRVMKLFSEVSTSLKLGTPIGLENVKGYKFYTTLLEGIVAVVRRFGISSAVVLKSFKDALVRDYKFERELSKLFLDGIWQFLFVALITWSFICLVNYLLKSQLNLYFATLIILWQMVGAILYATIFLLRKERHFKCFDQILSSTYMISLLIRAKLPVSKIIEESKLSGIEFSGKFKSKQLLEVKVDLEQLLEKYKTQGISINDSLEDLIEEIWFLLSEKTEEFKKLIYFLRFTCLVVFFLGAYFIQLFSIFGSLLGAL